MLWLGAVGFLASTAWSADKVKVGYFVYPPHLIAGAPGSKPTGSAVDVIEKHVAPKAKLEVEWVGPLPYARLLQMLEAGEIDAIGLTVATPERREKFVFSKTAPLRGKQGIVTLASEKLTALKSVDDLKGKTIGKLLKGYLPEFFEKNKGHFEAEEVGGDNSAEVNLKKVLMGRTWGAFFAFPDVLLYYAQKEKALDKVKLLPYPGGEEDVLGYFPMSRKSDPKIVKRFTDAVDASASEYNYLTMSKAYIDSAH